MPPFKPWNQLSRMRTKQAIFYFAKALCTIIWRLGLAIQYRRNTNFRTVLESFIFPALKPGRNYFSNLKNSKNQQWRCQKKQSLWVISGRRDREKNICEKDELGHPLCLYWGANSKLPKIAPKNQQRIWRKATLHEKKFKIRPYYNFQNYRYHETRTKNGRKLIRVQAVKVISKKLKDLKASPRDTKTIKLSALIMGSHVFDFIWVKNFAPICSFNRFVNFVKNTS